MARVAAAFASASGDGSAKRMPPAGPAKTPTATQPPAERAPAQLRLGGTPTEVLAVVGGSGLAPATLRGPRVVREDPVDFDPDAFGPDHHHKHNGNGHAHPNGHGNGHAPPADLPHGGVDLTAVARRFRLKAEAAKAVAEGRDPAEIVARRDKADGSCALWPLDLARPSGDAPAEESADKPARRGGHATRDDFATLAGCFEASAEACDLARIVEGDPKLEPRLSEALHLLAEAQSGVRDALAAVQRDPAAPDRDADQEAAFYWLKAVTADRRVLVERFMRLSQIAPRGNWPDVLGRIRAALAPLHDRKERDKLLKKVKFHAGHVASLPVDAGDEFALAEWAGLYKAVDLAAEAGVPASNVELRDLLLPLVDHLPDLDPPPRVRAVLEEVDRHRAAIEEAEAGESEGEAERRVSPTLAEARELLAGRTAVLIGGVPREASRARLERDLGLAELHWLSVQHHQSHEAVALPAIRRPEVSVVVVMTRWRSHAVGPAVRQWCKDLGKRCVELPAGYNAEQIAHQVVSQASEALATSGAA